MKDLVNKQLPILFATLILSISATAQTGGQFAITQSVVAGGGEGSNGGNFGLVGTTAQSNAGVASTNGQFIVSGGFWQAFFAPSAALASVSGKVTTANGFGIANIRVSMSDSLGSVQTAVTNSFGIFRFEQVTSGETYVLTVHSKRYEFTVPSQVIAVNENVSDIVFIANLR